MRGTGDRQGVFLGLLISVFVAVSIATVARADIPTVEPGAIELGLSGNFQSVEGSRSFSAALSLARYFGIGEQRLFVRGSTEYVKVGELDTSETALAGGFVLRTSESPSHPYAAVRFGIRQEWLGSFSQATYPVGFEVGVKVMTSRTAAFNAAYEYRRILGDPVSDYDEHRFVFGLSLFFRNERTEE